ncbi:tRNA-dihydrouridine synthase A [Rhodoligotrophos appendicifer]|uniref:tRNA dihydrouridine(20/20a) synthase DusA n=1 Tax=Rhodoligotrophos appendicifer TaxID=987056 RepID=UPI001184AB8A|nr:tRNA dihydrouridine(20/20a) synthase DusA [Rhodoligotrophos appendicifer]
MTTDHSHRFSVAPMMDWTDRHDRVFLRQISRHALLYTEMVTAQAVLRGDRARLLGFDAAEHPVALQLGGSEPALLAEAARIGADMGYDEINLNCGCPSDRVQSGRFGACLMAEPELVGECVAAMQAVVSVPVTVKCRIGIDDQDEAEALARFVSRVASAGIRHFIIHARKAWLKGLSPKENRDIPPLNYPLVHQLKQDNPHLLISINGGIASLEEAAAQLDRVDGVMMGRAAYQTPYVLADVDRRIFGDPTPAPSRGRVVERMLPYIDRQLAQGVPLNAITRHMLGLYNGLPGAHAWRRHLSENAHREGAGVKVVEHALERVKDRISEAA